MKCLLQYISDFRWNDEYLQTLNNFSWYLDETIRVEWNKFAIVPFSWVDISEMW